MRTRHLAAALAATAILTLTACGSDSDDDAAKDSKPTASATTSDLPKDTEESTAEAGIPPEPTGADRAALLHALTAINPGIATDEDKAIDAARNQCAAINEGADRLDWSASQRFSYGGNAVSEADGKLLNEALKKTFCKS